MRIFRNFQMKYVFVLNYFEPFPDVSNIGIIIH